MADGEAAGQAPREVGVAEGVAHPAHVALGVEALPVEGGDAASLLSAMLQGVQSERGQARGLVDAIDPEHATFESERVVVGIAVGGGPGVGVGAHRDCSTSSSMWSRARSS